MLLPCCIFKIDPSALLQLIMCRIFSKPLNLFFLLLSFPFSWLFCLQQFTQEQRHQQQLVKQSQQQQLFPSSSFESTSLSTSNPLSSSAVPLESVVSTTVPSVIPEQMVLNSDWAEVESIELVNDGTGLGFGIVGGKSSGVIIKQLVPGGAADRVSCTNG